MAQLLDFAEPCRPAVPVPFYVACSMNYANISRTVSGTSKSQIVHLVCTLQNLEPGKADTAYWLMQQKEKYSQLAQIGISAGRISSHHVHA